MPAVQTSYAATIKVGLEGDIATGWGGVVESESRLVETAAGIGFGRAVSAGAAEKGAIIGGTAAGFLGCSIRDMTLVTKAGQTADIYQRYDNMGVLNKGDIWVVSVNGNALNAVALIDGTTGQWNPAAAGITIPGSRFLTAATAGNLACLRLTRANP